MKIIKTEQRGKMIFAVLEDGRIVGLSESTIKRLSEVEEG